MPSLFELLNTALFVLLLFLQLRRNKTMSALDDAIDNLEVEVAKDETADGSAETLLTTLMQLSPTPPPAAAATPTRSPA